MLKMFALFDCFNRRVNETSKRLFQNVCSPHAVLLALMTTHIVFGMYGPHYNETTTSLCQNVLASLNKKSCTITKCLIASSWISSSYKDKRRQLPAQYNRITIERRCNPAVIINFYQTKKIDRWENITCAHVFFDSVFYSYAQSQSPPACLLSLILIGFRAQLHMLFTNLHRIFPPY